MTGYLGTLDGKFTIDPNGGAVYQVPLTLPPGTGGMAPELALCYNSGGANDILGLGWNLQGLSIISRVPATIANDGFIGAVRFDEHDRFSLDGQRLVAAGGQYGASNATYRTESETWRKITPVHDDAAGRSGPKAFVVLTKEGRRLEYGTSDDARVPVSPSNPTARMWALNRVTDRHGNYFAIHYQTEAGNLRPRRIEYTGNDRSGLSPQRAVVFEYIDRPDRPTHFLGGSSVVIGHLLSSIQTFVNGALVLRYDLEYAPGSSTGRSTLRSITQRDASGAALTPTTFDWTDGDEGIFHQASHAADSGLRMDAILLPMDIDGNGIVDIVAAMPDAHGRHLELKLLLASPERGAAWPSFQPAETLHPSGLNFGGQLLPADVDGDGCMDLVYATNHRGHLALTVFLARQVDGKWTLRMQGPAEQAGPAGLFWGGALFAADIDGDGRADLVYVTNERGRLSIQPLFSNGSSFEAGPALHTSLYYSEGALPVAVDWDGDGRTDIVYVSSLGERLALTRIASRGRDGFALVDTAPVGRDLPFGGTLLPMDINGDGKIDLIYATSSNGKLQLQPLFCDGVDFRLGEAQLTNIPSSGDSPPTLLPMELNGDGMTDLVAVYPHGNQVRVHALIATGDGFRVADNLLQPFASSSFGGQLLPLDLDGDGRTDLLYTTQSRGSLQLSRAIMAGSQPDMLRSITNGLGGRIEIDYLPMTDPSIYAKTAMDAAAQVEGQGLSGNAVSGAAFPEIPDSGLGKGTPGAVPATRSADFPKQLVARHHRHDGRGGVHTITHRYAGAKFDLAGRGWLGFAQVMTLDGGAGTTTIEEYNQESAAISPLLNKTPRCSTTVRSSDGVRLKRVAHHYETRQGPGGGFQVFPRRIETALYTYAAPGAQPDITLAKSYEYDAWGNITLAAEESSDGGAPLYTLDSYLPPDESRWLIGVKRESKMTSDRGGANVLAWERHTHDSDTGSLTLREVWDDQHQRWLRIQYEHDVYGNETSLTDPSGAAALTVFDSEFHAFAVEHHSPPVAGDRRIVTSSRFDPRFGEATATFAPQFTPPQPNPPIRAERVLDGLGRLVEMRVLGPSGALMPVSRRSWGHDAWGIFEQSDTRTSWDDGWRWQRMYHDGDSRAHRTAALGPDGARAVVVRRTFDSRGSAVRESLPHYEGDAELVIERKYDELGRILEVRTPVDAGGACSVTRTAYPSAITLVRTEAAGTALERGTQERHATFRGRAEVVERLDPAGARNTFAFDALGRALSATDGAGVSTSAAYDSLGRQVSLTIAAASATISQEQFTFDDVARSRVDTGAGGVRYTLRFDALKRTAFQQAGDDPATEFFYDAPDAPGVLARVHTPGASYEYSYDALQNQVGIETTVNGQTHSFRRTFGPERKLTSLSFPDGAVQTNRYNAAGALLSVSLRDIDGSETTHAVYTDHTSAGIPRQVTYANGVRELLTIDAAGRVDAHRVAAAGTAILENSFHWDELGMLRHIGDTLLPARSQSFAYDAVGRLTSATGDYSRQTFSYDGAGNLTHKNGVAFDYLGYRLRSGVRAGEKVVSAEYDPAGNMVAIRKPEGARTFEYDAQRRLVRSGGASFAYDHTGRRVLKQTAGGVVTSYVAHCYEVTRLSDGRLQRTKIIMGDHGVIGTVTHRPEGGSAPAGIPAPGTFYFHKNHIDSTSACTNASGALEGRVAYLPFGEVFRIDGTDSFRQKFAGKEFDAETGLYYFASRYYEPSTGRFLTADDRPGGPLHLHDTLNRYAYVLNNPITNMDPSGHDLWSGIADGFATMGSIIASGVVTAARSVASFASGASSVFSQRVFQLAVGFTVSTLLFVAGAAVVSANPMLGNTLMGAGIGGFIYTARVAASGEDFRWDKWGIQMGIGAAAGMVGGGFGRLGASSGYTVLFDAVGGSASGVFGQFLQNAAAHESLSHGLGVAAAFGFGAGLLASGASAAIARRLRRPAAESEWLLDSRRFTPGEEMSQHMILDKSWKNWAILKSTGVAFRGVSMLGQKFWYEHSL